MDVSKITDKKQFKEIRDDVGNQFRKKFLLSRADMAIEMEETGG